MNLIFKIGNSLPIGGLWLEEWKAGGLDKQVIANLPNSLPVLIVKNDYLAFQNHKGWYGS
jgi:hypothetical protein